MNRNYQYPQAHTDWLKLVVWLIIGALDLVVLYAIGWVLFTVFTH